MNEKKRFYMDETSVPYEKNENPYPRTTDDDDFDQKIIEKYQLQSEKNNP